MRQEPDLAGDAVAGEDTLVDQAVDGADRHAQPEGGFGGRQPVVGRALGSCRVGDAPDVRCLDMT